MIDFATSVLEKYSSAYLDQNGDVRIADPDQHKAFLFDEGFSEAESDQIVSDAKLLGVYTARF